jgi:hypothetical protein
MTCIILIIKKINKKCDNVLEVTKYVHTSDVEWSINFCTSNATFKITSRDKNILTLVEE